MIADVPYPASGAGCEHKIAMLNFYRTHIVYIGKVQVNGINASRSIFLILRSCSTCLSAFLRIK
jgi:hypothetical protein